MDSAAEKENLIDISTLERPILAIVRIASENKERRDFSGVLTPYYQVSISKANLSPSGEFIRFGGTHGDEIVGWRPVTDIVVEEVMGEYQGEMPLIATHIPGVQLVPFRQAQAVS